MAGLMLLVAHKAVPDLSKYSNKKITALKQEYRLITKRTQLLYVLV